MRNCKKVKLSGLFVKALRLLEHVGWMHTQTCRHIQPELFHFKYTSLPQNWKSFLHYRKMIRVEQEKKGTWSSLRVSKLIYIKSTLRKMCSTDDDYDGIFFFIIFAGAKDDFYCLCVLRGNFRDSLAFSLMGFNYGKCCGFGGRLLLVAH